MIRVAAPLAPARSLRPLSVVRKWFALSRQRQSLAALDANQLADIGLTAEQAQAEAARHFWDAPNHWLK